MTGPNRTARTAVAAVAGLVLAWGLASAMAGPEVRVHFAGLKLLASCLGASTAGGLAWLWGQGRRRLSLLVAAMGLGALGALAFWMLLVRSALG